jgi:hypothetical protein
VLTEAVSGVVGTADVLGGLGALLALAALAAPLWSMPFGVFMAMLVGLFSKESAIVCVPLVPLAAVWLAPFTHRKNPLRLLRGLLAFAAAAGAFVLYVECRKRWFPSATPPELLTPLAPDAGRASRLFRAFLLWFHQPALPKDPLNNPLVSADAPHRVAGALRVYFRALSQLVFPRTLSGDYSFPQEPVPDRLVFPESVLGAAAMVLPPIIALGLWLRSLRLEARASRLQRDADRFSSDPPPWGEPQPIRHGAAAVRGKAVRAALVALGLVWIVVSYFPHSNLVVLLPTVRAERFLYFPAIGSSVILAIFFAGLPGASRAPSPRSAATILFAAFFGFQCVRARMHALDYADDLVFWRATKEAVPRSAKAHLNYSVMWGARGHLDTRLAESRIAVELAPKWPMAHVYLGDTLCRLHRAEEAWPHYLNGFKLAENEPNLIALALQCLWDEKGIAQHQTELTALGSEHPGSWLDYLAKDIVENGEEHHGVDPKYRPRGYNEGPKE